jgi:hypothetical protein
MLSLLWDPRPQTAVLGREPPKSIYSGSLLEYNIAQGPVFVNIVRLLIASHSAGGGYGENEGIIFRIL